MQTLAEVCIRRPIFALMLILALVVAGAAGYVRLNVDRSPSVDLPTIYVNTSLPGASPVEIESLISQPLEQNLNTIEGIKERQEWELINSQKFGLLHSVDPAMRISTRYGAPTPDDLDELLALVREVLDEQ